MIKKSRDATCKIYSKYTNFLDKYASPLLLLAIRIYIGLIFYRSGMVKLSNIDSAIYLFQYEYNVPLLNPKFAAISSMIFEIGCSVLLFAGLFTRIAVLPLTAMCLVIQFCVEPNTEHFYWLFLLLTLAVYGAGKISVDSLFCGMCKKSKS